LRDAEPQVGAHVDDLARQQEDRQGPSVVIMLAVSMVRNIAIPPLDISALTSEVKTSDL
jgi:hypothetical protein